jgi:hypothetical protein
MAELHGSKTLPHKSELSVFSTLPHIASTGTYPGSKLKSPQTTIFAYGESLKISSTNILVSSAWPTRLIEEIKYP